MLHILIARFPRELFRIRLRTSINEELTRELHIPVIKNFKRIKVYARFKDNNSAADLAEMKSPPTMEVLNIHYQICFC